VAPLSKKLTGHSSGGTATNDEDRRSHGTHECATTVTQKTTSGCLILDRARRGIWTVAAAARPGRLGK
jgi:hypothetical protein